MTWLDSPVRQNAWYLSPNSPIINIRFFRNQRQQLILCVTFLLWIFQQQQIKFTFAYLQMLYLSFSISSTVKAPFLKDFFLWMLNKSLFVPCFHFFLSWLFSCVLTSFEKVTCFFLFFALGFFYLTSMFYLSSLPLYCPS